MKNQLFSLVSGAAVAALVALAPAKADTTTARCDVYPRGEDRATSSDTCTFSQRQGFVTITLKDGTTYELTPAPTQAATYTDQNGRPATREDDLGTAGAIYRLADVSIYVYWDASTVSSEPRRGEGNVPCSAGQPSYDLMCRVAAIYGNPGNSTLTVVGPTGNVLHLYYYGETLYSVNPSDAVLVQMVDGQYLVSVNDAEFFQLDATIVTGVD
jgi:hypothetical protein